MSRLTGSGFRRVSWIIIAALIIVSLGRAAFDDKTDDARAFFEEHGGTWPVIDDPENRIGVAFGVAQVPETFVIAPDGTVVQRYAGGVTRAALDELITSYEAAAAP